MRASANKYGNDSRRRYVDKKLLDILVCPSCKGPLVYDKKKSELVCKADRLAYPIRDDIPVMLEDEARQVAEEELPK
jgi:uncharacterized protein YbaR (Trm112 family)